MIVMTKELSDIKWMCVISHGLTYQFTKRSPTYDR